jgi:hypothetical protein
LKTTASTFIVCCLKNGATMKKLLFTSVLFLVCSCGQHENVIPSIIIKNHKQTQYEHAVLEIYRLNTFHSCDCKGFVQKNNQTVGDSINLLEGVVILDTLILRHDSTYYFFRFIDPESGFEITTHLRESFTDCINYNGLMYLGDSLSPKIAFVPERGFSIYGVDLFKQVIDSCFYDCINNNIYSANNGCGSNLMYIYMPFLSICFQNCCHRPSVQMRPRSNKICCAAGIVQRMPELLSRCLASTLQAASVTPDPIG